MTYNVFSGTLNPIHFTSTTIGKQTVKQHYVLHMSSQYGELRPTSSWDRSGSLRHPCKFQQVSWQRDCTASSSGRQPNFAALNRGRHLCSAGRLSRWALAHILVWLFFKMAAVRHLIFLKGRFLNCEYGSENQCTLWCKILCRLVKPLRKMAIFGFVKMAAVRLVDFF